MAGGMRCKCRQSTPLIPVDWSLTRTGTPPAPAGCAGYHRRDARQSNSHRKLASPSVRRWPRNRLLRCAVPAGWRSHVDRGYPRHDRRWTVAVHHPGPYQRRGVRDAGAGDQRRRPWWLVCYRDRHTAGSAASTVNVVERRATAVVAEVAEVAVAGHRPHRGHHPRSPIIGSTAAATARELAGDLLVLQRHDQPGVEVEVSVGWISRDGQQIIVPRVRARRRSGPDLCGGAAGG